MVQGTKFHKKINSLRKSKKLLKNQKKNKKIFKSLKIPKYLEKSRIKNLKNEIKYLKQI
jgi:hypothetical protein